MLPRLKLASIFLLLALMLSFMPAGTSVGYAADGVCDQAELGAANASDGTFAPGAAFDKTWQLKNIGTCTWETTYSIVFESGNQLGAPASSALPIAVKPGETVAITLHMTAPAALGNYIGNWKLKNAGGTLFGIGTPPTSPFTVNIVVGNPPTLATGGYDFVANAASAAWSSGAGALTLSTTDAATGPLALKLDKPLFEDGRDTYGAGLLFFPNNAAKGFVKAVYPPYFVQNGDRFQAQIGCQNGATTCYVAYQLFYQIDGTSQEILFWKTDSSNPFRERYEGLTYPVNVSLNALAGKNVRFILKVTDWDGSPAGDRALWGGPRITQSGGPIPPPCSDRAQFVSDVNVPDGTIFTPNAPITKTWRIKNIGTCTWTNAYQFVYDSGTKMGADTFSFDTVAAPKSVATGQTVDITVNLTAPATAASYIEKFKFKNDKGVSFGVVRYGNPYLVSQTPIWVAIKVSGTAITGTLALFTSANPLTYTKVDDVITYTYIITNSGTGNIGPTQFTVSDTRINGGTSFNCGAANTTLIPGATVSCTNTYKIVQADLALISFTNKAIASGGGAVPSLPASFIVTKQ